MAAFAIAIIMHVATNWVHVRADIQQRATAIARTAGVGTIEALSRNDAAAAMSALGALRYEPMVDVAEVYLPDGQKIATYDRAAAGVQLKTSSTPLVVHRNQFQLTVPAVHEGAVLGSVHILLPLAAFYPDWRAFSLISVAAIVAAVLIPYWLAARLQKQISGPLVNLAQTMQRVSAEEDYSLRVERSSEDEIGTLIDGFNQMLGQIRHRDSRLEKYRQFLELLNEERTVNLGNANLELKLVIAAATRVKEPAQRGRSAKSEFLARMSHELRTPMNGVMGMAELLQGTELTAGQRRLAETIPRSAVGLLEIINDILDFSKIEAGKLELEHIEFALREIIEETIEILVLRARAKGLELRCEIAAAVPAAVRGDPVRLRQVLINLAGNAIKFTETGEVVVRVAALDADGSLRFEVSDTGIGIAAEAQSQIFSAFTQADSFTTRKYGGTGLGLAICRQLVALMGGVIGVASEQNRGSTFWFEIRMEPVAAPAVLAVPAVRPAVAHLPAAAAATGVPSATGAVGPLILVVEDNAVNREVAAGMLENLGYRSEAAVNGLLALEAVAETTHAGVVMDCQMPVMDGLTATQEIRRREAGSGGRMPIIALTANAMEANRERCLAAGMDDFLPKPFTQVQLAAVLGRWAPVAHAPRHDQALLAAGETAQAMTSAATAAAMDIAVIDTEVLRNIAALGRPALLGSLIDLYLEHSRPLLETIESAIRGREPAGLPEALHTLKSSSANLGGARLTELLRECESLAQEGGVAAVSQLARVPLAHHEFCEALIRERSALAA